MIDNEMKVFIVLHISVFMCLYVGDGGAITLKTKYLWKRASFLVLFFSNNEQFRKQNFTQYIMSCFIYKQTNLCIHAMRAGSVWHHLLRRFLINVQILKETNEYTKTTTTSTNQMKYTPLNLDNLRRKIPNK